MPLNDHAVEREYRPDRRRHVRYPVRGSLSLEIEQGRYEAVPVDLGMGGVLFRSEQLPPLHSKGRMQLSIDGFGEKITGDVQVVEIRGTLAAGVFILPWTILKNFIAWLDSKGLEEKAMPGAG